MRPRIQAHCQSRAHSARPSQPARQLFLQKDDVIVLRYVQSIFAIGRQIPSDPHMKLQPNESSVYFFAQFRGVRRGVLPT
jgi:hypothetical protein